MLFKELAKIGAEQLSKQQPTTLEKARAQAQRIEARISNRNNQTMTFQERAKLAMEALAKQPPATYEQVLEQVRRLKEQNEVVKKQRPEPQ
jgi:hypothetical protein